MLSNEFRDPNPKFPSLGSRWDEGTPEEMLRQGFLAEVTRHQPLISQLHKCLHIFSRKMILISAPSPFFLQY